jgi:hypothetical protein
MSENVGASTYRNPKGLHGLYGNNFAFTFHVPKGTYTKAIKQATLLVEFFSTESILCSYWHVLPDLFIPANVATTQKDEHNTFKF